MFVFRICVVKASVNSSLSSSVRSAFVRCVDKAQADRLSGVEVGEGWIGEVITGKEEEEYHAKIDRDKKDKRSGKVVVKKTKTKTKLLQKAELLKNSHMYFD